MAKELSGKIIKLGSGRNVKSTIASVPNPEPKKTVFQLENSITSK